MQLAKVTVIITVFLRSSWQIVHQAQQSFLDDQKLHSSCVWALSGLFCASYPFRYNYLTEF